MAFAILFYRKDFKMDNFKRIARFEKVSLEQYLASVDFDKEEALKIYNEIKLPKRATKGSAGYDFYIPFNVTLAPG